MELKKTLECHPSIKRIIRELLKGHIPLGCPLMNPKPLFQIKNMCRSKMKKVVKKKETKPPRIEQTNQSLDKTSWAENKKKLGNLTIDGVVTRNEERIPFNKNPYRKRIRWTWLNSHKWSIKSLEMKIRNHTGICI